MITMTNKTIAALRRFHGLVEFLFRRKEKPQSEKITYNYLQTTFPVKRMSVGRLPGGDHLRRRRLKKKRAKFERKIAVLADELKQRLDRKQYIEMTVEG